MKLLNLIANILLIIGGINLGLIGLAHLDLLGRLFAYNMGFIRVLYVAIGFAGIIKIVLLTFYKQELNK